MPQSTPFRAIPEDLFSETLGLGLGLELCSWRGLLTNVELGLGLGLGLGIRGTV